MPFPALKPRCQQNGIPSTGSRAGSISLPFLAFRGSCGLFPSPNSAMPGWAVLPLRHTDADSSASSFHVKGRLRLHWAHLDNPGCFPDVKVSWLAVLTPSTTLSPLYQVSYSQFLRIRMQTSFWGCYFAYHSILGQTRSQGYHQLQRRLINQLACEREQKIMIG